MLKFRKKKKREKVVINLSKLKPLQENLAEELLSYQITEPIKKRIIQTVLEDVARHNLNPYEPLELFYFSRNAPRSYPSETADSKDSFPELSVFLDSRDWLFNAVSGECLAGGMLLREGVKNV